MDPDDENYNLMVSQRNSYMDTVRHEARKNGVTISNWEIEEIELAFEHAFCEGYIAASHQRRSGELN